MTIVGAKVLRLALHGVGQREAVGVRNAGIVVDVAGDDDLATHGLLLEQNAVEHGTLRVDCRRKTSGTATYDDQVLNVVFRS